MRLCAYIFFCEVVVSKRQLFTIPWCIVMAECNINQVFLALPLFPVAVLIEEVAP
jgi:hypothetical protein